MTGQHAAKRRQPSYVVHSPAAPAPSCQQLVALWHDYVLTSGSGGVGSLGGMRLLVTGGAGFIGSHYVRTLLSGGYPGANDAEVTVFDKLTYAGNLANLSPVKDNPRYTFVQGDILDGDLLDEVLPGHDGVLNFAAETHVDRSIHGAADFALTNSVGVQTLLDACMRAGIPRVVQVSTDEVYGSIETGSFEEASPLAPNSPYSAAKAGGDLLARAYFVTHKLDVSITRCTNNYGPYQYPEKVIPLFVTNLVDDLQVPLYGDGLNVRDWLHVDDHCRG
ncbi:MAG TPA: GDP-mannose 4,6-dehydratase, partial [Mycobacteriales bacterium]|nr:GDP-mannose 4,6-dehydratase [Mycobacteriales bacterium]